MEDELAAHAGRLLAELAVVLPEVVHRADEPVVVRRVEADGAFSVAEHARPEQGRLVEMDDVELLGGEDRVERARLQRRAPAQVGRERREAAEARPERVHRDVRMVRKLPARAGVGQELVRVDAVDDGDAVPGARELVREQVEVVRLAAVVVRRVEGADHAEGERFRGHRRSLTVGAAASDSNSCSRSAAASQVRCRTACRARSPRSRGSARISRSRRTSASRSVGSK